MITDGVEEKNCQTVAVAKSIPADYKLNPDWQIFLFAAFLLLQVLVKNLPVCLFKMQAVSLQQKWTKCPYRMMKKIFKNCVDSQIFALHTAPRRGVRPCPQGAKKSQNNTILKLLTRRIYEII